MAESGAGSSRNTKESEDMAESGAGSSRNTNEDEDRSYVGVLTERFVSKYGNWIEEHHAPQTNQEYFAGLETSQTGACAGMGALHYQREKGVRLSKVTGTDSHVFEQKWLSPENNGLCFHANFSARFEGEEVDRHFFTELTGIKGPEIVTSCVRLGMSGTQRNYSVGNCNFCTGLWHPLQVNFLGQIDRTRKAETLEPGFTPAKKIRGGRP